MCIIASLEVTWAPKEAKFFRKVNIFGLELFEVFLYLGVGGGQLRGIWGQAIREYPAIPKKHGVKIFFHRKGMIDSQLLLMLRVYFQFSNLHKS